MAGEVMMDLLITEVRSITESIMERMNLPDETNILME